MAHKFIQFIITFCILAVSQSVSATYMSCKSDYHPSSLISNDYGYDLDESTNIVTGGGLEWLQWDETVGMTVGQAITEYGVDGWRLATSTEMSNLLNSFFNVNTNSLLDLDISIKNSHIADFIDMFGVTDSADILGLTLFDATKAFYLDSKGKPSFVTITDGILLDTILITSKPLNWLTLLVDSGVAFVKDISGPGASLPVAQPDGNDHAVVPEPGSVLLFAVGLILLVGRNKYTLALYQNVRS